GSDGDNGNGGNGNGGNGNGGDGNGGDGNGGNGNGENEYPNENNRGARKQYSISAIVQRNTKSSMLLAHC
ncbi:hypothetical protein Tco_0574525, partial [Tanacetum coccineum]